MKIDLDLFSEVTTARFFANLTNLTEKVFPDQKKPHMSILFLK